jgi:hypothetical protein
MSSAIIGGYDQYRICFEARGKTLNGHPHLGLPWGVIDATDLRHDETARYHHGKHVVITCYL